nr:hypothetical protein [Streptomyces carpinensis]
MHVLEHQYRHVESAEDLDEGAEEPVPGRGRVLQRLRRRRQMCRPLREQRPQRTAQTAEAQPGHAGDAVPHRVDDRAEGVRHAQLRAGPDQRPAPALGLGREELP